MSVQMLPAAPAATATPAKAGKGHLNQVDLVRVLTFASVIAVHVITYTNDGASVTAYGALTLLHFTRSVFFFLTGFVLVYTYRRRPLATGNFWRRRMSLVGIPYLVWTAFYFGVIQQVGMPGLPIGEFLDDLWGCIYKGIGWFHLYFLLVSLQFYILFPFVLAALKATVRHHKKILIGSAVLQLGISLAETYLPAPSDPDSLLGQLWGNQGTLVVSYQFFLIAGCIAAFHYEAFQAWITAHSRFIWWGLGLSATFALAWYGVNLAYGHTPGDATGVLQPEMLPWYGFVVLSLYLVGSRWADRQATGSRWQRIVAAASQRSFGVFLVHPAMLWVFLNEFDMWFPNHLDQGLPLTLSAYVFAVVTSLIFVEIVIRTPLAKVLIGRARIPFTKPAPKVNPEPHPAAA